MNYMVVDKIHWEKVGFRGMAVMDFIFMDTGNNTFTVLKNREDGIGYKNVNWAFCNDLLDKWANRRESEDA